MLACPVYPGGWAGYTGCLADEELVMFCTLRRTLVLLSILLLGALLPACGKKGPLYLPLPDDQPPAARPVTPTPQPHAVTPP